jgi:single-strand DNA-binding protein
MNSINIIGNITKDIELRYTQTEKAVANFTIAYNDGYGKNQQTYFFDVEVWNKQAENVAQYCQKGSKVAIEGKLKQDTWEHEGKKQSKVKITAFNITFLDTKKDRQATEETQAIEEQEEDPFQAFGDSIEISEDDLPF